MFRSENNRRYSQRIKSKMSKIIKSGSYHNSQPKHSKHFKNRKRQKHNKHSKMKHFNPISDYVGPERLTKHVGFFTKGKISNSISRLENAMPEVKARVKQDLREVLKLSWNEKKGLKKERNDNHGSISSKAPSFQAELNSPPYLYHETRFASNAWKEKLQKSVGNTGCNSILDSVHKRIHKSPIEKPQLIAKKLILTKIHPLIKETNNVLFPTISYEDKFKRKLLQLQTQYAITRHSTENSPCSSSIHDSLRVSQSSKTNKSSQSTVEENFCLNPIFTGETTIDISDLFPSASNFNHKGKPVKDVFTSVPKEFDNCKIGNCLSSIGENSPVNYKHKSPTMNYEHKSPTSSEDSPAWKLQISPVKFVPELGCTPTLYFRHKLF